MCLMVIGDFKIFSRTQPVTQRTLSHSLYDVYIHRDPLRLTGAHQKGEDLHHAAGQAKGRRFDHVCLV